ncbi:MAG: STAS domain-containing protein [Candidatus Wallbacteria bacterium]|nr:STAS domain-containing protein [Candidatus Wallbacteria bacterium]
MNISSRASGSVQVVTVGEDVTQETVRDFTTFLDRLVDGGTAAVVLDLARVLYLTSRGLGAIISAYTVLRKRGGNLVLMQCQPEVRRLLELTRLDRILEVAQSETEALAKLTR